MLKQCKCDASCQEYGREALSHSESPTYEAKAKENRRPIVVWIGKVPFLGFRFGNDRRK
jgi:hypothetical protein